MQPARGGVRSSESLCENSDFFIVNGPAPHILQDESVTYVHRIYVTYVPERFIEKGNILTKSVHY
jgi:hypothetical protein